jgi:hypothetical protein
MANNPDPENLGWGIAAGIAILAAVGGYFKSIASRSAPCDAKNEAFRKSMDDKFARLERDFGALKDTITNAVAHADRIHEGISIRSGEHHTAIAVLDTKLSSLDSRLTTCQRGINDIKRNGHK